MTLLLRVHLLEHAFAPPGYQSDGASGMDLFAAVKEPLSIAPGEVASVPTGVRIEIPDGYEGQIRGRSGLAARHALGIPNAPGTIDADYRGEVRVLLINWGRAPYQIRRGDRIAQLVIAPVARPVVEVVEELSGTVRGDGGFGHTGR